MRYLNKFLRTLIVLLGGIQLTWAVERPGFGIAIDDESRSMPQNSIRVLLYNFNSKRAEEVNYYSPKIKEGSYILSNQEKHLSNPIVGFIANGETINVVVNNNFNIGQYIILSKFNVFILHSPIDYSFSLENQKKTEIQSTRMLDDEKFRVFMRDQPLQLFQEIGGQINWFDRTHKKLNPTFRLVDIISLATKTAGHLKEALDKANSHSLSKEKKEEEDDDDDPFYLHKEDLGENVTFLVLLSLGYRNIYRANRAIRGHDLVVCSGNNPQQDELILIDSEWTCETSASNTRLNAKINVGLIWNRMIQLKTKIEKENHSGQIDQELYLFNLLRSFFSTPHARIYKLLFKIYDRPKENKRGVAKPWVERMEEDERIKIAEKAGILDVQNASGDVLVFPMERLLITQIKHNPNDVESLQKFMSFLGQQQGVNLVPSLWELLREKYPDYYNAFFDSK